MRLIAYTSIIIVFCIIASCSTESTPVYNLTTSSNPFEGGVVVQSAQQADEGESISITANPNEHWLFDGWQGDLTGSQNPGSVLMDRDKNVTARFVKRDYPLTINVEGSGTVTEEIVASRTTDYQHGTVVKLTAEPKEGWMFKEWQGSLTGNQSPVEIEIDGPNKSVTAVFEINTYSLSTSAQGEGTITIDPQKDMYEHGDSLAITASPSPGWSFAGWQGAYTGNDNPLSIAIKSDLEITGVFEQEQYEISVTAIGQGSVSYQPLKDKYVYGDEIQLQATPHADIEFIRWQGDLSSKNLSETFTVTGNHEISAVFQSVLEAVKQRWGSMSIINNRLSTAGLSLSNGLPEVITVTNFRLLNENGALVGQSSETHNVASGSNLSFTITFNTFVTTTSFSNYTGDWLFTYKGNNYRKTAKVGSFGSASKIIGGESESIEIDIETFEP